MWKEYSLSYIKRNKASSFSIMVTGLIATLFFSMICCVFYNLWRYDIEHIIRDEGDWQGRIVNETGSADTEELQQGIQNHGNVERVNIWEDQDDRTVIDIYFEDVRQAFRDMPRIAEQAGLADAEVSCHDYLLSQYLIFNPEDEQPPMLLGFFILVMALAAGSLILIIRNAFAVSMNSRIHQMGILSSIGATPRQIRTCLLQEASALCIIPILAGSVGGIGLSLGLIRIMEWAVRDMSARAPVRFQYHPAVFLITILASGMTVFLSAWFPARRMGRLTPLQAVRNESEYQLKKRKESRILAALFGMEGELAGNALKARKRALWTSFTSLTLSFLAFSMFLCFITLSEISVNYTYYEKYKDSWDVMVKIEGAGNEDSSDIMESEPEEMLELKEVPKPEEMPETGEILDIENEAKSKGAGEIEEVRKIEGVESCVAYRKVTAFTRIEKEAFSEELQALGGMGAVCESAVQTGEDAWEVEVPLIILDDKGFAEYCRQIGVMPQLDGSIMLNRIWDSVNSNFRYREYIPFVKESMQELLLADEAKDKDEDDARGTVDDGRSDSVGYGVDDEKTSRLKIFAHTETPPVLREEYDDYALVQVIPVSLWRQISNRIKSERTGGEIYLRILASDDSKVNAIETAVNEIFSGGYSIETENRVQEEITNSNMMDAYRLIVGGLCALLAVIGIANLFSNTLGFLYQRKREFARYLSIGVTPGGIRKILWIEAIVIAGKPILVTMPLTILFVAFAVRASYLDPWEFIVAAPIMPMLAYVGFVFLFVGTAYYIGGRGLLNSDLGEILRDDVMA